MYYGIISDCVDWAHNGGISGSQLDAWRRDQGKLVRPRGTHVRQTESSITYVDDSAGFGSVTTSLIDMDDIDTIISKLIAEDGINPDKNEGPAESLVVIGWRVAVSEGTVAPSDRGLHKMFWWCFRKAGPKVKSVVLADFRSLLGVLRWYSTVIPLTRGGTHAMETALAITESEARRLPEKIHWVRLGGAVKAELNLWRDVLSGGLTNPSYWKMPAWVLADQLDGWDRLEVFTDAATTKGGGYVVPDQTFAQFWWTAEELQLAAEIHGTKTDINILEFVTVVLMVLVEYKRFAGKVLLCRVDNVSAVAWLNKLSTRHKWGQAWVRMLFLVCVKYNIRIVSTHIRGIYNVIADELSRFEQTVVDRLLRTGSQQKDVATVICRMRIWKISSSDGWSALYDQTRKELTSLGIDI
jgi:hypothetical protein